MKKMIRLSVSGNHSQLTILLCLVSFNLSRNFLKFRLNYIEKVKCPDGHSSCYRFVNVQKMLPLASVAICSVSIAFYILF